MSITTIASGGMRAHISTRGAEMVLLQSHDCDLLWNGDPQFWTGHAPVLFPIVGEVKDGRINVDGRRYPMGRHGFARTSTFDLVDVRPDSCRFRLTDNAETRTAYPFAFILEIRYSVSDTALAVEALLSNPEPIRALPASLGFHPALRRPLPFGGSFEEHCLLFPHDEESPIRQLDQNLLLPKSIPSPVQGRRLVLTDSLFENDALIFDQIRSRSVWYGSPPHPGLRIEFSDFPYLGVWSKPRAGFLCIEPWQGLASDADFDGEFAKKRGVISIGPGEVRSWSYQLSVGVPPNGSEQQRDATNHT